MTFYLLAVTKDGETSYSLWESYKDAWAEMRPLNVEHNVDPNDMDIVELSLIPEKPREASGVGSKGFDEYGYYGENNGPV